MIHAATQVSSQYERVRERDNTHDSRGVVVHAKDGSAVLGGRPLGTDAAEPGGRSHDTAVRYRR
jgi:hypothetical protein